MVETLVTCPKCGAHNPQGAEWCSQCYAALVPEEDRREQLAGEEEQRFARPTESISVSGKPVYSRWAGTEVSFGPVGRILATILVIGIGVLLGFNYSPVPAVIWLFLGAPVLLRSIWKRVPVRYEREGIHLPPPVPPAEH
jgi:hypothetical protein